MRKLAASKPRLGRFLSLFDEQFALYDALEWLADLKFAALADPKSQAFAKVKQFVNQPGFLPAGVLLDDVTATPKRVVFVDGTGARVPVEELSDGFRSILALTLELLRQLTIAFGDTTFDPANPTRVIIPGVVMIDEIDVHLHPTWQRTIGSWLTTAFPNMQFLVTTHSPLVCQSAERGTVFLLPDPGAQEAGRFLSGAEKDRLVFGNVLDALGTGAFGQDVAQSDAGVRLVERLAALNTRELTTALTQPEREERDALRRKLPSDAAILTSSGKGP